MRLLKIDGAGGLSLTEDLQDNLPAYAILSHTWGDDKDEVNFDDLRSESWKKKAGAAKIRFCGEQAKKDNMAHFWVDTCCINKANSTEYSEAINSMFRWYRNADKCYVFLLDVSIYSRDANSRQTWEQAFRDSRWFTRGWTLQELLAPASVEFFSREEQRLGDKKALEQLIHEITDIPTAALRGAALSQFSVDDRLRWAEKRNTKKQEDKAYCLLGIFGVFMPLIYGEGEYAFTRLKGEIDKSLRGTGSPSGNVHWAVPRSPNTLFTGRKDILDKLERIVRSTVRHAPGSNQCRVVIAGLGGQGKSEISLQLAQRVRPLFWGVFWVDVSTSSLAENGFLDITRRLQIPVSTWEDSRQALANITRRWMLVLDNADDPNVDYQAYFPPGSSGVVVLTSRNAECEQYATAEYVALEGLPTDDATELLLKAAGVPSSQRLLEDDAREVAILLQSHALALIQAGAYIQRGHCTLADYPRAFERQRKRLLEFRPSQAQSRYRDVYATFEAAVEILQASQAQSARDALEVLPLLAVCGPSQLPLSVFEAAWKGAQRIQTRQAADEDDFPLMAWHVSRLPSLMQVSDDVWDSFRLVEAVNALRTFALVSTTVEHGQMSVSMHPLVHAWARDRQDEPQQHESWICMGCVVAVSASEKEMWRIYARQLQPHLQAITSWEMRCAFQSEPQVMVASILVECGWQLQKMRDDKTVFMLLDRLCSHLKLDRFSVDEGWVGLYHIIGRNLLFSGKIRDAVKLLEEVARVQQQTLGKHHQARLASQLNLARVYMADGQVKVAIPLLEEVVRIDQTLPEDHPDRLASQHDLGQAYTENGQVKEAVELLEGVVRIQETMAEDHPNRLASQHALALAYEADGQIEEGVKLLEEVVRVEQTVSKDHPARLASQLELAQAYVVSGKVKDAKRLLEEVVRIQETMAEDHPERLLSQNNLAICLWKLGQHFPALEMMRHVVETCKRVFDPDHPHRIRSEEALEYWEEECAECGGVT
ncbi:hypothetical protein A1O7_04617 [Cladophialophora yegresii CBS 114405]|uniref:Uncharacterized protein n=1 Tax=Cladophialophora yegresii CBS 114405 TaxID=1182544 RepID=W9WQ09_9EURO|nr:uncharacterized protein A1O7_04617 [Cladophialophora yegresii CBS 114405]EXJ60464.1 hypothetical protein A1O7_04617 [Cladophialophora yegresii CBS 114405]